LSPYKYVYTISYQYNYFHIPTWYQRVSLGFSLSHLEQPPAAQTPAATHVQPPPREGGILPGRLPSSRCPLSSAPRPQQLPLVGASARCSPRSAPPPTSVVSLWRRGPGVPLSRRGRGRPPRPQPTVGSPPPHARLPSADGHGPLGGSNHGGAHAGPAAGLDPPAAALMAADAAPPLLRPPAPTPPCSWARPSSPSPWAPSPSSSVLLCAAAAILAAGVPPPSRTRRRRPSSTHLAAWSPISPVQPAVCNLPLRQRGHACSSRRGLVGTRTAAATGRRGAAGALVPNHRRPFLLSSSRWPSPNCLR
jgi:hypothetical protein